MGEFDDLLKVMVVGFVGIVLVFGLMFYIVSIQDQAHNDFCQTKLVYNNSEYWCLNEDDEKLYAIACDSFSFDGLPIDCYYKSNLVKEAG